MATSNREIPHYHLTTTIDMHKALAWLAERNTDRPPAQRLLPAALLLRASALAAAQHHQLNGFWVDDEFRPATGVQLGVAIALRGGGLVAPAIRDADQLSVDDTMAALRDLVTRSRRSALRGSELSGGSITVTNLGERGAESVLGVIYPPQVALVGFGRIVERPWVSTGDVVVRPTVTASLSADHRATDGHLGSLFLESIDQALQQPEALDPAPADHRSATTTEETIQ
jgi:pyruvate dehydrogenase E2 component (dihydrolipoamide acetyltransferase)